MWWSTLLPVMVKTSASEDSIVSEQVTVLGFLSHPMQQTLPVTNCPSFPVPTAGQSATLPAMTVAVSQ